MPVAYPLGSSDRRYFKELRLSAFTLAQYVYIQLRSRGIKFRSPKTESRSIKRKNMTSLAGTLRSVLLGAYLDKNG